MGMCCITHQGYPSAVRYPLLNGIPPQELIVNQNLRWDTLDCFRECSVPALDDAEHLFDLAGGIPRFCDIPSILKQASANVSVHVDSFNYYLMRSKAGHGL